jgi:prepilin-type N-terminal cleavage/methylation domain-containing protein
MTDARTDVRRGVTLLEVLISIGVMSIGLMGMVSLIPLGRLELAEAERMDNSASLGRAAFREVTVRGYLRPEMWVDPLTGRTVCPPGGFTDIYSPTGGSSSARQFGSSTGQIGPPYAPLVVDPLMIAPRFYGETVNATALNAQEIAHRTRCLTFPFSISLPGVQGGWPEQTAPKIARVTLRSVPPSMAGGTSGGTNQMHTVMRFDSASRFFRAGNDLTITVPVDKALRPMQEFAVTTSTVSNLTLTPSDGVSFERRVNNVAYRKFKGDYSWFFIVEPSMAEAYWPTPESMPIMGGPSASLLTTRQFRVWTVICNKRDLRDTGTMDLTEDRAVGERMCWVDFIDRNTARLRMLNLDRGTAMKALDVKQNQWFAVVGAYQEPRLNNQRKFVMEWYRIVNVSDEVQNQDGSDTWFREVTVAGREFSNLGFEFQDADAYAYPDVTAVSRAAGGGSSEPLTGWGVLVSGVRSVYEKSVYVDRPSSWALE